MKKFITMLLVCTMVCSNITFLNDSNSLQTEAVQTEVAQVETSDDIESDISVENAELVGQETRKELYINPLYKDVIDEKEIQ